MPRRAGRADERAGARTGAASTRRSPPGMTRDRGLPVARPRRTTRRTSTRRSPRRSTRSSDVVPPALAAGRHGARVRVDGVRLPVRGRRRSGSARSTLTGQLRDMGVYQVSLGDTIGVANPQQVEDVLGRVLAEHPAGRDRGALPRHPGHRARELPRRAADGHHDDRRVGRRARRLPVRAGRVGQPRDRGRRRDAALRWASRPGSISTS